MDTTEIYHRHKETKSRTPINARHPMIEGAARVLEEQGGGPLTSCAVFRRGVEMGVFRAHQYNSLRARLSQHCDLDGAQVVRARGSKIGVRGARTTAWVLADTGLGIQQVPAGDHVARVNINEARRRKLQRTHAARAAEHVHARNLILDDHALEGAPESARLVAGRTAREALLSDLDPAAVNWLLEHLPIEPELRARLMEAAHSLEERSVVIEAEERRIG
jgi:hypothetical protein